MIGGKAHTKYNFLDMPNQAHTWTQLCDVREGHECSHLTRHMFPYNMSYTVTNKFEGDGGIISFVTYVHMMFYHVRLC